MLHRDTSSHQPPPFPFNWNFPPWWFHFRHCFPLNLSLTRIMLMLTVPPSLHPLCYILQPRESLRWACRRRWKMARNGCLGTRSLVTWTPQSFFSLSVPYSLSRLLPLPRSPCLLSLSFSLKWCVPPVIYIILFWHLYFSHQSRYLLSVYLLSEHVSSLSGHAQKINFTVFLPSFFPCKIQSSWNDRSKIMKTTMQAIFFVLAGWILRYFFYLIVCHLSWKRSALYFF